MGTLTNAIISLLVPLPSILFHLSFVLHHHSTTSSPLHQWCLRHPLLLANLLFLLNVDLLFWLIGLLLRNHWMIDLYWTVIPVLLTHYFSTHPMAEADARRSAVAIALVWLWSARLTHSYFRRERWEWGAREDWRFAEMRTQYGKHWWWLSFFPVYVSQQRVGRRAQSGALMTHFTRTSRVRDDAFAVGAACDQRGSEVRMGHNIFAWRLSVQN